MKLWAVVKNGEPLEQVEQADPTPVGAEVLLEVSYCGVCHSDLHFWKGEYNLGHGNIMRITDRGVTLPRAPGHEVVGRVVAVGPDAQDVKPGDLRIVYPWIGCGECARCKAGEDNLCLKQASIGVVRHGGFASHVLVPHSRYLVDPGDIDPALAATFACSGLTVLAAIRKLGRLDPDSTVAVIGAGGVGLSAVMMLQALDHHNIVVVDLDPEKRKAALAAGASAVVDGGVANLSEEIIRVAGGPVAYALDCVNVSSTARAAFDALGKGGKLVLLGVSGGELDLSLAGMVFTARSVMGSATGTLQDLKDVVALARAGKLKPIPIERMPVSAAADANAALNKLKSGAVTGRLVMETAPGEKAR